MFVPDDLRRLAREVASYPDGVYRFFLGEIRRQKRSLRLGKPVKRVVRRSVRRNAQDVRWSNEIRGRDYVCRVTMEHMGLFNLRYLHGPQKRSEEAAHI